MASHPKVDVRKLLKALYHKPRNPNSRMAKLGPVQETPAREAVLIIDELFEGGATGHTVTTGQASSSSSAHNPATH